MLLLALAAIASLRLRDSSRLAPSASGDGTDHEGPFATVREVERQPLFAQVARLRQALEQRGDPLPREVEQQLEAAEAERGDDGAVERVQAALDPLCIAAVRIAPDGRLTAGVAPRPIVLDEQGARVCLIKVHNPQGVGTTLSVISDAAGPLAGSPAEEVADRWLTLENCDDRPLSPRLSGLALEYRAVQLGATVSGRRSATLMFDLGRWPDGSRSARPDDSVLRTWDFKGGLDGWECGDPSRLRPGDGALEVRGGSKGGPVLSSKLGVPVQRLEARIMARTEHDSTLRWFWLTREQPHQSTDRMATLDLEPDGHWHQYVIRFFARSPLTELRLQPSDTPGLVEVRSVALAEAEIARYNPAPISARFEIRPAREVVLDLKDDEGRPTTGAIEIVDGQQRVYPARGKRLAPDFFFQRQVYRSDGELLRLPTGRYQARFRRGPESIPEQRELIVKDQSGRQALSFRVRRWIDPAKRGWWSGDHHVHAAGCRHYASPTEGVGPADILRHCLGEDLKVAHSLTWGPCYGYQSQFFTGQTDRASRPPYLVRYDVEVSGFGSHQSGHLCLLGLKEMDYPGESLDRLKNWPTLGLTIARWAKAQGATVGAAHAAGGLAGSAGRVEGVDGPDRLPDFTIPPFNGIGANEFIVDVTHEVPGADGRPVPAVDFLGTMNDDRRLALNLWYHLLNCGLRPRLAGETDFPCFSGQRIGIGRTYVKVDGPLTDEAWLRGLREGRSYASDGTCHLLDFRVEPVGKPGEAVDVGEADLRANRPLDVIARVKVAGRRDDGSAQPLRVETVLNGYPCGMQEVPADGGVRELCFRLTFRRSSWLAVRVFPAAHTNPVFVLVEGKPIRASRSSAEWCLRGVDQCWHEKEGFYHAEERERARQAYEHARRYYRRVQDESSGG